MKNNYGEERVPYWGEGECEIIRSNEREGKKKEKGDEEIERKKSFFSLRSQKSLNGSKVFSIIVSRFSIKILG